jgi:hypothetical protein
MFDLMENDGLLIVRLKGILDAKMAESMVELIEIKEAHLEKGFDRFCDFTGLEGIELSSSDIFELTNRRRAFNLNDVHVKSAFLSTDLLGFGIARMYEQLLNSPRIEVRVFRDVQSAADWLGVALARLTVEGPDQAKDKGAVRRAP